MKKVIVTGANSGIGEAIAEYFAKNNWQVALLGRNKERLDQVAERLPHSSPFVCDLANKQSIVECANEIKTQFASIDCLINNAGIFEAGSVEEDDDGLWDDHYSINLLGPVRLTRQFWDHFKQTQASIVNISSTLAIRPIANTAAYSALKAAMNNWTQSLALEGAPHGIRANVICPGIVDTPIHPFHKNQSPEMLETYKTVQGAQPLGRIGQPKDIAPLAYHFGSDQSTWTTGSVINVDGGILLNS